MKIEWNEKEKKLIKSFQGTGEPTSIADLARDAFPSMGRKSTSKGNSWVRNSLRKPIKHKFVKQLGRGLYVLLKNPLERPKTSGKRGKNTQTRSVSKMNVSRVAKTNGQAKKAKVSNGATHVAMATSTPSGASEAAAV